MSLPSFSISDEKKFYRHYAPLSLYRNVHFFILFQYFILLKI